MQIDESVANNADTDPSIIIMKSPNGMETAIDSKIESDDVLVAEVIEDKILIRTADDDDLHLSQEPLSMQDFSTTTLPSLEEGGKNINALSLLSIAAPPTFAVVPFHEIPSLPDISEQPIAKPINKRAHIKFKLQGIMANKTLFLNINEVPASVADATPLDYFVTWLITDIPSSHNNQHYIV